MSTLYYRRKLITPPAVEPFVIGDFTGNSEFMKSLSYPADTQSYITDYLIKTARMQMEEDLGRKLITQTWEISLDLTPFEIDLPYGNLQSVTSVKIISDADVETTESSSKYHVTTGDNGKIWLTSSTANWTTTTRVIDLMRIRFVCGYGATAASIPVPILQGILNYIRWMYDNPGKNIPDDIKNSVFKYKIIGA